MLYACSRVKNILLKVGEIPQLEIQCKHLILGLYSRNTTNNVRNIIIVTIMYAVYCPWVKCNVKLHSFKDFVLKSFVKQQVIFYTNVFNYVFKDNHRRKTIQKYKVFVNYRVLLCICIYVFFMVVCFGHSSTFEVSVNDYLY